MVLFSLLMAGIAQLLNLVDPLIFGKIIDDYTGNRQGRTGQQLVQGVLTWLAIAIGVALLARLAKAFQDYTTRLACSGLGCRFSTMG